MNIEFGSLLKLTNIGKRKLENVHFTMVINVFPVLTGSRTELGIGSLLFHLIDYLYCCTYETVNPCK